MITKKGSRKFFLLLLIITVMSLAALYSHSIFQPFKIHNQEAIKGSELYVEFTASPNPFETYTVLSVTVEEPLRGTIFITDTDGNIVNNLYSGTLKEGPNEIVWHGVNDEGEQLPRGRYTCNLMVEQQRYTSRTIILILK